MAASPHPADHTDLHWTKRVKAEAILLHLLQPTARHRLLFLVECGSGAGSLQVFYSACELPAEVASWVPAVPTTPHRQGSAGNAAVAQEQGVLTGLLQWGGGGPSATTPPPPADLPATRDFLRLPEQSSAS